MKFSNKRPLAKKLAIIHSFIFVVICLLQGLFTFGSSKALLRQSTSTLQIDTRNATIDDILGNFELKNIVSETPTTTSRPTRVPTTAPTSTAEAIDPKTAANAKEYLNNMTNILESILADPSTSPDFSLARVFNVNDFLTLGNSGFLCHSDNLDKDNIKQTFGAFNGCPMNGFLSCMGRSPKKSMYSSNAYSKINKTYLLTMTTLSEPEINYLVSLFSNLRSSLKVNSIRMNIPASSINKMEKLTCGDDYIYSDSRGTSQNSSSKTWALGMTSLIFAALTMIMFVTSIFRCILAGIAFVLYLAQFGLTFSVSLDSAKFINDETGGLHADGTRGYIGFFTALLVLYLAVFGSFGFFFISEKHMDESNKRINEQNYNPPLQNQRKTALSEKNEEKTSASNDPPPSYAV